MSKREDEMKKIRERFTEKDIELLEATAEFLVVHAENQTLTRIIRYGDFAAALLGERGWGVEDKFKPVGERLERALNHAMGSTGPLGNFALSCLSEGWAKIHDEDDELPDVITRALFGVKRALAGQVNCPVDWARLLIPEEENQAEEKLTPEQAAELLGVLTSTLKDWRKKGKGPPYIKLTTSRGHVRYDAALFNKWLRRHTVIPGEETIKKRRIARIY